MQHRADATLKVEKRRGYGDRLAATTMDREEIYRRLSNGDDRLAHAGQTLHDIIVKIA